MSYKIFEPSRPDVAASGATRTTEITYTRENLTALMDLLAQGGIGQGFDISIVSSTSDGPTDVRYTNSNQIVKKNITYGSGATAGLPVTVELYKSTDTGATFIYMAQVDYAYDGSGNFLTSTWS